MYQKERVKGFEEYQVDTEGVIYSKRGLPLKYSLNPRGYCIVNFYVNRKRTGFAVHTIVATQFIPNPEHKEEVNHKDGDKTNNRIDNLEWVTRSENMRHAVDVLELPIGKHNCRKVIGYDKKSMKVKYSFESLSSVARYFHPVKDYYKHRNSVWRAIKGYRKTYKGCVWKYVS